MCDFLRAGKLANIYKPIKEFKTRTEVKAYMSRKSVTWKKDQELSEWFEKDCFFSTENELLCIPRGKSDNIRGGAALLQNYQAVKEDLNSPARPIESVLLEGFQAYIGEPEKISALAEEFLESKGFHLESGWGAAITNLDRWIDQMFEDGDAALLFQDNDTLCGLCAVAGEALREKLRTDSKWVVNEVPYVSPDGDEKKLYHANLRTGEGKVVKVCTWLESQLADPDHSTTRTILRTFVRAFS